MKIYNYLLFHFIKLSAKDESIPVGNAILFFSLFQSINTFSIMLIIMIFFNVNWFTLPSYYYVLILLFFIMLNCFYLFYKKRYKKIIEKYDKKNSFKYKIVGKIVLISYMVISFIFCVVLALIRADKI